MSHVQVQILLLNTREFNFTFLLNSYEFNYK